MPTFTETSPRESRGHKLWKSWTQTVTNHETMKFWWKSPTQITKVADTNHFDMSRCLRQSRDKSATNPFVSFWWNLAHYNARGKSATKSATKSVTSSRQSRGLVVNTNHESRQHDLWRGLSWFVSATRPRLVENLSRTLLQSRHNEIWA